MSDKDESEHILWDVDNQPETHELGASTNVDLSIYKIDVEKIKSLDDVVRIIEALDIRVSKVYPHFAMISDLLKKSDD